MDIKHLSPIDIALQEEYERELIRMLIGSDEQKKEEILQHCCAEMFTNYNYRSIFKAITELKAEKKELNVGNLIEKGKKEEIKK